MNPWNTLAAGHCWSLRRAWAQLVDLDANNADDAPGVRSVAVGVVGRASGYNDPSAVAVLSRVTSGTRYTRTVKVARESITEGYWLTRSALRDRPAIPGPILVQVAHGVAELDPDTARDVARHLERADTAVRRYLGLEPDHRPLDHNPPCPEPGCRQRLLRLWTSAPNRDQWTVICTAPRKAQAVPHIWAGDQATNLIHPTKAAA